MGWRIHLFTSTLSPRDSNGCLSLMNEGFRLAAALLLQRLFFGGREGGEGKKEREKNN